MAFKRWLLALRDTPQSAAISGISLEVAEVPSLRFGPHSKPHVEELEIGATGPSQLQFVLISRRRRAVVKLSAEQARWLAGALIHWADSSETMSVN